MKTATKKKTAIAALSAVFALSLAGGAMLSANADEGGTQLPTLTGFECAGVSVNAEEIGMRFVFDLSGDAVSYGDKTAGVVYMPYDLYTGDINAFAKDTDKAQTATFNWKDNTETADDTTDKVGYTYMNASVIPTTMYNRVLLVRGYIEDGENVYYTAPIKTSMAYSAWKGIDALGSEYTDTLKAYMGPYKLTYGDGENDNVSGLHYGDTFTLPTQIDGHDVAKWYWDEAKTNEIEKNDYATGSMSVYYKLQSFTLSGSLSGADNLDTLEVYEGDTKIPVTVSGAKYTLSLEGGAHTLTFCTEGYYANVTVTVNNENVSQDVILKPDTFVPGTYLNSRGSVGTFADNDDGTYTVTKSGTDYSIQFPNTATNEAFTFEAEFEKPQSQNCYGISLSAGQARFHFSFQDNQCALVLGSGNNQILGDVIRYNDLSWLQSTFDANTRYWGKTEDTHKTITVKLVVTQEKIEFYVWGVLRLSFTKDTWTDEANSSTLNWGGDKDIDYIKQQAQSICFGSDGKINKLCVGIQGAKTDNNSVSTVKIHKLSWTKGEIAKVNMFEAGSYLNSKGSVGTLTDNGDGTYTVTKSGTDYSIQFPNTATNEAFTFEAEFEKPQSQNCYGVSLSAGQARFHFSFQDNQCALVLGSGNNQILGDVIRYNDLSWLQTTFDSNTRYWGKTEDTHKTITVKLVVTQEKIEFYVWNVLRLSFTKDSWNDTANSSALNWSGDKTIDYIKQQAQSICFGSDGKINKLCVGIQGAKTDNNSVSTVKIHKLSWTKGVDEA